MQNKATFYGPYIVTVTYTYFQIHTESLSPQIRSLNPQLQLLREQGRAMQNPLGDDDGGI